MERKIGLVGATAIGLGAIIGAGIFVLSGTTINLAGSGAILAFVLTGVIALLYAFELGELTNEMPEESGATYSFTYKAFGSQFGFITGILAYMSYAASISAIATGFGSYLTVLLGLGSSLSIVFSIAIILILSFISLRGIKKAAELDIGLVSFKIIALLVLVLFAVLFGSWTSSNFGNPIVKGWGGIFAASVIALFAYSGFSTIASLTPSIEGGGRTAAKAIIISAVISMALYLAVTAAMMALVPASKFPISADPLGFALASAHAPEWLFLLIGIAALVATASATLSMINGGTRYIYQIAKDGLLPRFLSNRSGNGVETNAMYVTAAVSILLLFSGNIYTIAAISNFGTIFGYMMSSFVLLKLRRIVNMKASGVKAKLMRNIRINTKNVPRVPLYPYLPVAILVLSILLFYGFPQSAISSGLMVLLVSFIAYAALRELENKPVIRIRFFR